ncbi:vacuole effluxer Atg22 like-domain-containing protein [Trametes elegans]|nr:vacuole effluxer Atg22 like-domain-containing protein [Trametes elegans]
MSPSDTTSEAASSPTRPSLVGVDTEHPSVKCDGRLVSIAIVDVLFDGHEEPIVTRKELWSYYWYYSGANGVGPLSYSAAIFQALVNAAGYDPVQGSGSNCTAPGASGQCVVLWAGTPRSVNSVVLIANGIGFAIMSLLFTTVSSLADYGSGGRWVLLIATVVCWIAQFASVVLTGPSRWGLAMAIYVISFVAYGAVYVFYVSVFPRLARHTPRARQLKTRYERGDILLEEYEREESMEVNRISYISTAYSEMGFVVVLALNLAVLLPRADDPRANTYAIVLTTGYWVLVGIWWFVFQRPRPGPSLPPGERYLAIGWKQIWLALKQFRQLPNTFIYLAAFFLLADGYNTSTSLVYLCQNDRFQFSFLQNTYLLLVQAISSAISLLSFWYIQRRWKFSTRAMFTASNVSTTLIPVWGMIGLWTSRFGFRNAWEFWAYNVVSGLFQAPYWAYSQTMMAELTPPGFDYMFFGLFGLSNRASSLIGSNVVQAIINRSGNSWTGFPFLFALCSAASLTICFCVDVKKGRRDAQAWSQKHRAYNVFEYPIPRPSPSYPFVRLRGLHPLSSTSMDTLPIEILERIYLLACTDGGYTGCSLSLTSKYIRAASRAARFNTIRLLSGSDAQLNRFTACFSTQRELAGEDGTRPKVQHLCLAAAQQAVSPPASPSGSSPSADVPTTESHKQTQRYIRDVIVLMQIAAPDVVTLCLIDPDQLNSGVLHLPTLHTAGFPSLVELAIVGKEPQLQPTSGTCDPLFPRLRTFHRVFLPRAPYDPTFRVWRERAPQLQDPRVAFLGNYYGGLADVVQKLLRDHKVQLSLTMRELVAPSSLRTTTQQRTLSAPSDPRA